MNVELIALAKEYISLDKDNETRSQIHKLLECKEFERLNGLLSNRISFGTSGLRAAIGPGYSQMNCLTVIQTTQGLVSYLLKVDPQVKKRGVVIGHDHRHKSLEFAKLASAVFLSVDIPVYLFRTLVHTPMVPFSILELNASCGIMITASHNPKTDNGYKLYWSNGSQIISPIDKDISISILDNLTPWIWDYNLAYEKAHDPKDCIDKYFDKLKQYSMFNEKQSSNVKFCYTPIHGVGHPFALRVFQLFGLSPFVPVKEQVNPDPEFPTVKFPNPEEGKGALELAIKTANENQCRIILANDPDADRLALAEKQSNGSWRIFTGNEIAIILSFIVYSNFLSKNPSCDKSKIAMLSSTVSSRFIQVMAKKEGFVHHETLTGFKWLGNKASELQSNGYNVIFAFEEAIGFMVGTIVYDKDGISSMGVLAQQINQYYKQEGFSLSGLLQRLYEQYGYFYSNNGYYICHSPETINRIFTRMREYKESSYPERIGKTRVKHIRDLTVPYDSEQPDKIPILPTSKSSQMITFKLENGCVLTLRTSGTEPKIKWYSEIYSADKQGVKETLDETVQDMIQELLEPTLNGLIPQSL